MRSDQIMFLLPAALLAVLPFAVARKCYTCNSLQNPACADGYQTGSMQYQDCSTSQFGGQFSQQGGGIGIGGQPQQGGFPPQGGAFPAQGGGQFGSPYGGTLDRCMKITTVGAVNSPNGQPSIQRLCGSSMAQGMQGGSDGCSWQGMMQICTCDSNYCNASSRISTSKSLAIVTALFGFIGSLIFCQSL